MDNREFDGQVIWEREEDCHYLIRTVNDNCLVATIYDKKYVEDTKKFIEKITNYPTYVEKVEVE